MKQIKKHTNQLRLSLQAESQVSTNHSNNDSRESISSIDHLTDRQSSNASADDFDDFLEQEYNDNHHKHYRLEHDQDHLRADENPMKLFESIQALARSLHEDSELFGSLPKRYSYDSLLYMINV